MDPSIISCLTDKKLDLLFEWAQYMKKHNSSVPTLFKQYVELYEMGAVRFFDFMINEGLHGIVEAFILTDNSKMKKDKKICYIKKF